jgi:hypothetical protein
MSGSSAAAPSGSRARDQRASWPSRSRRPRRQPAFVATTFPPFDRDRLHRSDPRADAGSQRALCWKRCARRSLESRLWDTNGTHVAMTANKNPRFPGVLEADDGTRTHDLLHGKCERPFAPVRTRSVKRLDCGTFPRIERTRPHPSERRTLPFLPRKRTHRASGTVSSAACRSEAARTRSSARRIVGVSGSSSSESGFGGRARPKSASQLGSLSSAARGPRTRRRGERSP